MQFADPQDLSTAYLILRHLYDGDVIEWPIADDHPCRAVFQGLEQQGLVARWDRTWPRHDRYRLTEAGIAAIEAVYRPAGADAIWAHLRAANLSAAQRRAYLSGQGYDPTLWALLADPSTHWDTYRTDGGRYMDYVWEDRRGRRYRNSIIDDVLDDDDDDAEDLADAVADVADVVLASPAHTVDLDREAQVGPELEKPDYDVS